MSIDESFEACREFIIFQHKNSTLRDDHYFGKSNVSVDDMLYKNISVSVTYQVGYMDYKVEIFWEQDDSQPDYKDIGLHGKYSSNFQIFSFNEAVNALSFYDGSHEIVIHPL